MCVRTTIYERNHNPHLSSKRMKLKCTRDQVTDIFMKPLKIDALGKFKSLLGMINGGEFGFMRNVSN